MRFVSFALVLSLAAALGAFACAPASATTFPVQGSRGDQSEPDTCPQGQYMVGVGARAGAWLDQIQILCGAIQPDLTWVSTGTTVPRGGLGGGPVASAACASNEVVESIIPSSDEDNAEVTSLEVYCVNLATKAMSNEDVWGTSHAYFTGQPQACPNNELANGLTINFGKYVNGVGLICTAYSPPAPVNTVCQDYANAAVAAVQQATSLGCGLTGPRWNPSYQVHYDACVGFNAETQANETNGRQQDLAACQTRLAAPRFKPINGLKIKPVVVAAAGPPSSGVLMCQGGGMQPVTGAMDSPIGGVPGALPGTPVQALSIPFKASGQGANAGQPAQGECAWADRPVGSDQPNVLVVPLTGIPGSLQMLVDAAVKGGTFQVYAFVDVRYGLVVSAIETVSVMDSTPLSPGPANNSANNNGGSSGAGTATDDDEAVLLPPSGDDADQPRLVKTLRAVSVHKAADKHATVFGSLAGNKTVTLLGCDKGWCHVQFKGGEGYVSQDFLDLSGSGSTSAGGGFNVEIPLPGKGKLVITAPNQGNGATAPDQGDANTTASNGDGGVVQPPAPQLANFAGVWNSSTDKGWHYTITLSQNGAHVTGGYVAQDNSKGTIDGNIDLSNPKSFVFAWKQDGGYIGTGHFTMTSDGVMDGSYHTDLPASLDPSLVSGKWHAERQ